MLWNASSAAHGGGSSHDNDRYSNNSQRQEEPQRVGDDEARGYYPDREPTITSVGAVDEEMLGWAIIAERMLMDAVSLSICQVDEPTARASLYEAYAGELHSLTAAFVTSTHRAIARETKRLAMEAEALAAKAAAQSSFPLPPPLPSAPAAAVTDPKTVVELEATKEKLAASETTLQLLTQITEEAHKQHVEYAGRLATADAEIARLQTAQQTLEALLSESEEAYRALFESKNEADRNCNDAQNELHSVRQRLQETQSSLDAKTAELDSVKESLEAVTVRHSQLESDMAALEDAACAQRTEFDELVAAMEAEQQDREADVQQRLLHLHQQLHMVWNTLPDSRGAPANYSDHNERDGAAMVVDGNLNSMAHLVDTLQARAYESNARAAEWEAEAYRLQEALQSVGAPLAQDRELSLAPAQAARDPRSGAPHAQQGGADGFSPSLVASPQPHPPPAREAEGAGESEQDSGCGTTDKDVLLVQPPDIGYQRILPSPKVNPVTASLLRVTEQVRQLREPSIGRLPAAIAGYSRPALTAAPADDRQMASVLAVPRPSTTSADIASVSTMTANATATSAGGGAAQGVVSTTSGKAAAPASFLSADVVRTPRPLTRHPPSAVAGGGGPSHVAGVVGITPTSPSSSATPTISRVLYWQQYTPFQSKASDSSPYYNNNYNYGTAPSSSSAAAPAPPAPPPVTAEASTSHHTNAAPPLHPSMRGAAPDHAHHSHSTTSSVQEEAAEAGLPVSVGASAANSVHSAVDTPFAIHHSGSGGGFHSHPHHDRAVGGGGEATAMTGGAPPPPALQHPRQRREGSTSSSLRGGIEAYGADRSAWRERMTQLQSELRGLRRDLGVQRSV